MKKRIFASVMCIILSLSILVSCGKDKNASSIDANGNYVPSKDMKITVWQTQGTDFTSKVLQGSVVEEWLVNKTRVKVDNAYGNDGGQWDAKLTKLVSGNNLPEIIACGAYQGPAHFAKLNELGQVWELTPEMLQKYAPNVWNRVPEKYWEAIKVDGKILGIPCDASEISSKTHPKATEQELETMKTLYKTPYNDITIAGIQTLWVRDDILKQIYPEAKSYDELVKLLDEKGEPIGEELLDIPIYTTEEYIDFMYKIKDLKIKENGKTVYPFGYSGGDNWCALSWLGADMYGYKGHYYTGTWNSVTQEIEIPLVGDVIREAAKTQNKMLADMVIDPESMTHTSSQAKEKILNGLYAIAPIDGVGTASDINNSLAQQGKNFRYRPFYTQVPHMEEYGPYEEDLMWSSSLCILKTVDEEGLYQLLNWINVQFSDEYEAVKYWGPEDAGLYEEDENGIRRFKDERFTKYYIEGDTSALKEEETLGLGGPTSAGYTAGGLFSVNAASSSRWDPKVHQNYIKYTPMPRSGFKFKEDSEHVKSVKHYPPCQGWSAVYADIPEVVTFWAEREQWENLFKIAMAAPTKDFDKKWDEAIAGLNKIVDIKTLESEMTKVAKPLAEVLTEE